MDERMGTIIITGGGTGGHLYPALAVAEAIRRLNPDIPLLFIGRDTEKERKEVESREIPFKGLPLQGLRRKLSFSNFRAIALTVSGIVKCLMQMRGLRKGVVFGLGGYVSAPAMIAGKLLGWQITLHEQNTIPGLVNRKISRWCDAIFVSYARTLEYFQGAPVMISGMPVRQELIRSRNPSTRQFQETVSILVIGGSQGAKKVVEHALAAFTLLNERKVKFHALVQTGEKNFHWAQTLLRTNNVTLTPFINNMDSAYNNADLLISRAGSSSLSEIALWGLPSILIPYPFASDDHQRVNAEVFSDAGAAVLMHESEMTPARLCTQIEDLILQRDKRLEMGRQARSLAREDAADVIANQLILMTQERLS